MGALEQQQVISGLTPDARDILFWELRDSKIAKNKRPKKYGEKHPNPLEYPKHRLVFIAPHETEGKQKWFYAAIRADQEEYNWQVSYPFPNLTTTPIFETVFITCREDFIPIEKGTEHPY